MRDILRTVNLEEGLPTTVQARTRLLGELQQARRSGVRILKLIHGYGSSGAGGDLRLALQSLLRQMADRKEIQECIFGEDWSKSDERAWTIVKRFPQFKQDRDFGKKNKGITIVVL
jgi:hypothetical protein